MSRLQSEASEKALAALLDNDETLDRLAHEAVQDALREHKRRGESIVVWRDGQVVTLAPEEIPIDDEPGAVLAA